MCHSCLHLQNGREDYNVSRLSSFHYIMQTARHPKTSEACQVFIEGEERGKLADGRLATGIGC